MHVKFVLRIPLAMWLFWYEQWLFSDFINTLKQFQSSILSLLTVIPWIDWPGKISGLFDSLKYLLVRCTNYWCGREVYIKGCRLRGMGSSLGSSRCYLTSVHICGWGWAKRLTLRKFIESLYAQNLNHEAKQIRKLAIHWLLYCTCIPSGSLGFWSFISQTPWSHQGGCRVGYTPSLIARALLII